MCVLKVWVTAEAACWRGLALLKPFKIHFVTVLKSGLALLDSRLNLHSWTEVILLPQLHM